MGSPRRVQRDQDRRVDIKDRLQALAKTSSNDARTAGSSNNRSSKSLNSGRDRGKNEKLSSRKESIERVMERARTEGGNRWTKKLLDEEAKDPDRWGHSGFKEMYKNELGMNKNRRSRSREKPNLRHSRSRERTFKTEGGRTTSYRERSTLGSQRASTNSRKKRSRSSSDRSLNPDLKWRTDSTRPGNGTSHDRKTSSDKQPKSHANRTGKSDVTKKYLERRRDIALKKERVTTKKRSPLLSRSRSRSPLRLSEKNNVHSKKQNNTVKAKTTRRGPVSPPERGRSRSDSQSRSTSSPVYRRRACLSDEASSRTSSSLSRSSFSRSSSSSSSSSGSSTSMSSRDAGHRKRSAPKPRSPPVLARMKVKEQLKSSQDTHTAKQTVVSKTVKRPISTTKSLSSSLKKRRTHSDSESSSNGSSSETEDEDVEEGEDDEDGDKDETENGSNNAKDSKSGNLAPRLSLSERFGKLAQLSSQRRNLELVQLRIVAPVGGASTTEKNVSIDENSAAPVITNSKVQRERSVEPSLPPVNHHHHQMKNIHPPEDPIRKDERARDDRWRDWHERYDQYRHVQPPRQLPRDWDDIRVRHKYYTDRGYFGHDMTLEELSRWEAWWHRYQQWRRGYEHAWVKTHGPHVPVEYPDWTHYRSTNNRGEAAQLGPINSSIRSRLGWRR